jgi:eukaryotic-like serine/threonine-protein kinase
VSAAGSGLPPCAVAETATAGAARALAAHGVTSDPARPARTAFAGVDACTLLTPEDLARVPGASGSGTAGFARWSCAWGRSGEVDAWLVVDGPSPRLYGTRTSVDGRTAFVNPGPGGCSAWVMQRPYGPGAAPAELVQVNVEAVQPDPCGTALTLASAAASRLR